MVSLLSYQAGRYFATGEIPERMGNFHPNISPYETFKTRDGYFNLATGNDTLFNKFCELIDREDLLEDERFASNPDRVEHRHEIHEIIENETLKKTTEEWLQACSEAGIPAGAIHDVEEVVNHPQIQHRQMVEEVDHSEAGPVQVTGIPIKMSKTQGKVEDPPPTLGQHTEEILEEKLGYSKSDIENLRENEAI